MRLSKRARTTAVVAASAVMVAGAAGGAFLKQQATPAHAATAFVSHPVTVNPDYQQVGDPSTTVYSCQVTTPAGCYSPTQIQNAYGFTPLLAQGYNGSGRTIVIIDAFQSPAINSDLATFDSLFGLPAPTFNIIAPDGLTPYDPNDANMQGWAGEITLDVEWAHAVAPGATIDLVLAKSNEDVDILRATQYAIDHNLGDVISQSFGENESCVDPNLLKAEHATFQAANAKGITLIASAGDSGAAEVNCSGTAYVLAASSPASDPLVLSIGGTSLNASPVVIDPNTHQVTSTGGAYLGETEWNDVFGAGGGGYSTIYARPTYQAPFGVPNGSRGVPDVAYSAAVIPGVLGVFTPAGAQHTYRFGGTSAGSPQWAGIVAIADQYAGTRVGFLQDNLYHIAKTPAYGSDFHDVTTGNNSFGGIDGFSAGTGWDADTGLGSPNVANLVPDLTNTHVGNGGKNL